MSGKHWSIKTAFEQVNKCDFECEGGPLKNNQAYNWLEAAAQVGPEFWPGQGVFYEITAEVSGIKLSQFAHFYIVGCSMSSDCERRYWTYSLSNDPPHPWHYGKVNYTGIKSGDLHLEKPAALKASSNAAGE